MSSSLPIHILDRIWLVTRADRVGRIPLWQRWAMTVVDSNHNTSSHPATLLS
jgi:hypothetical protein